MFHSLALMVGCVAWWWAGQSAAQDVMCMANRCPPQMVHTMLDPQGVGVAVLWQTFARTLGNSTVWLGTVSGNYTLLVDSQREQSITQSESG